MRRLKKGLISSGRLLLIALGFIILLTSADGDLRVFATRTGSRYHREGCSSLRSSRIPITLEEAVRRGLEPCGICNPPALGGVPAVAEGLSPRSAANPGLSAPWDAPSDGLYRVNRLNLGASRLGDTSKMIAAQVVRHVDGDTVRVRIPNPPEGLEEEETIRMLGVDTPETRHPSRPVERFGKEASDFTRDNLLGKQVYLAFDWDLRDNYGRLLTYIYTAPGRCFNAALVQAGYAHAYTRFTFQFMEEFRRLEQEARGAARGLWAP